MKRNRRRGPEGAAAVWSLAVWAGLIGVPLQGQEPPSCAQAPTVPQNPPVAEAGSFSWFADPGRVDHWAEWGRARLGIGHLALDEGDGHFYDWPDFVALPLWHAPVGDPAGWLTAGRIYDAAGSGTPLTGAGTVETDYELQTLYVLARETGGWLQIRVAAPGPEDAGLRWTHECHLGLGVQDLVFESWDTVLSRHAEWLFFRSQEEQPLREAAGDDALLVSMISSDHEIELLEMAGAWSRVRVREPAWTCFGDAEDFTGTVREGWVRWFDEEVGPRLWYPTRGC